MSASARRRAEARGPGPSRPDAAARVRRALCAAAVAACLPAAAAAEASAAVPGGWKPEVAAAKAWARERAGEISFAVRTQARVWGRRADRRVSSASVIKAMLLAAYLRRPDVRHRALRADERDLLGPMIRWSDNVAASRVRDILGDAAIARFARRVGMRRFVVNPWWGLSRITARDQTRFFLRIDRTLPARHRRYGMRLLRTIVPSQRWGLARVAPAGWVLYFKGGWGDASGTVEHQVGLLWRGTLRVAIAVLVTASPSSAYGRASLAGVARRLLRGLARVGRGRSARLSASPRQAIPWTGGWAASWQWPLPRGGSLTAPPSASLDW